MARWGQLQRSPRQGSRRLRIRHADGLSGLQQRAYGGIVTRLSAVRKLHGHLDRKCTTRQQDISCLAIERPPDRGKQASPNGFAYEVVAEHERVIVQTEN